ncbi:MAG: hypothetical protein IJ736_11830 [Firmicutes bacterium]|nr:hypothetical protein [Bacillota bacterium]
MNNEYDESMEEMLDELYEIIYDSKTGGFFSKNGFDKDRALELVDLVKNGLPSEIRQAQKICDSSDRIIEDANNKAKNIIKDAEVEAERMVSNHEITKRAKEEAKILREDAKDYQRKIQSYALNYAEECITRSMKSINESLEIYVQQSKDTERALTEEINTMYANIQDLRSNNNNNL